MKISLIIIGYNTLNTLKSVLDSVNQIKYNNECEVLYIDDASADESVNYFNNFNLQFNKKVFSFSKNRGRVAARQKAIELSSGDWLCFIQSNVTVDGFLLCEYEKLIKETGALAFAGQVNYQSNDNVFENYLNRSKRGLNPYQHKEKIHFKNLLFGNCMIKKSVFKVVPFNLELKYYGGSELDFSFRLSKQYPNKTIANKNSIVTRINHLGFKEHCNKLIEYGNLNLKLLPQELRHEVIKFPFLLYKSILFKAMSFCLFFFCLKAYKIQIFSINVLCIRLGLLCAILQGYYRSK
mgnify:CR=1 FL=1